MTYLTVAEIFYYHYHHHHHWFYCPWRSQATQQEVFLYKPGMWTQFSTPNLKDHTTALNFDPWKNDESIALNWFPQRWKPMHFTGWLEDIVYTTNFASIIPPYHAWWSLVSDEHRTRTLLSLQTGKEHEAFLHEILPIELPHYPFTTMLTSN